MNGWFATASPARPTERNKNGTTAGMGVAISNHVDNRPAATCTDAEGTLAANAQLTARLLVLDWIEIILLAGYLISEL